MKSSISYQPNAEPVSEKPEIQRCQHDVLERFTDKLFENGLSVTSIKRLRIPAGQFLSFLEKQSIGIGDVTVSDITEFWLACGERLSAPSMHKVRHMLRLLLSYLHIIGAHEHNLTYALPPAFRGRTTRIKRYFSDDEVDAVLAAVDCTTVIGKRDYAMLLLAATTALRVGDILKLKIVDIDWNRSQISIVQHKNKRLHTVPLLPCTGNAILNYILNGRPNSNNPFLFLSCRPPYNELKTVSCSASIMKKWTSVAGIDMADRATGFHVLRVHAASKLLTEGVPLFAISGFLGHRSPSSIKPYLSVDVSGMRSCCLSLEGIEVRGIQ